MKNQVMGLLFLSVVLLVSGCGLSSDKSPLAFSGINKNGTDQIIVKPGSTESADPQFQIIKQNLVDVSCIKCHSANQTKHIDLTSRSVVLENADDILYRMTDAWTVGTGKMPPRGNAVDVKVINEFKAWKSDAQFANLQTKLFAVSCLKCHGATQTRHTNLSSKEVVIENYDEIIYKMTNAFDESNKPMPPVGKGTRVSPELIKELQKWKESL